MKNVMSVFLFSEECAFKLNRNFVHREIVAVAIRAGPNI